VWRSAADGGRLCKRTNNFLLDYCTFCRLIGFASFELFASCFVCVLPMYSEVSLYFSFIVFLHGLICRMRITWFQFWNDSALEWRVCTMQWLLFAVGRCGANSNKMITKASITVCVKALLWVFKPRPALWLSGTEVKQAVDTSCQKRKVYCWWTGQASGWVQLPRGQAGGAEGDQERFEGFRRWVLSGFQPDATSLLCLFLKKKNGVRDTSMPV